MVPGAAAAAIGDGAVASTGESFWLKGGERLLLDSNDGAGRGPSVDDCAKLLMELPDALLLFDDDS
jgi:hypothetical protein